MQRVRKQARDRRSCWVRASKHMQEWANRDQEMGTQYCTIFFFFFRRDLKTSISGLFFFTVTHVPDPHPLWYPSAKQCVGVSSLDILSLPERTCFPKTAENDALVHLIHSYDLFCKLRPACWRRPVSWEMNPLCGVPGGASVAEEKIVCVQRSSVQKSLLTYSWPCVQIHHVVYNQNALDPPFAEIQKRCISN